MADQSQCAKTVFTDLFGGHRCGNWGKIKAEDKWWCGIHSPAGIAKRRAAELARWAKRDAQWKAKNDRETEQQRRAECYPDLLEALEGIWIESHNPEVERIAQDAIKKAKGA